MLISAKVHKAIASTLLALVVASGTHATEQTTQSTQAETTPRPNNGGPITGSSQCEARTINYITHSLPQSCLTTSWSSTTAVVESTPPPPTRESATIGEDTAPTVTNTETTEATSTTTENQETSETLDADATAEPFMSFEDWKEMMLQKSGQDPQELKQRKTSEAQGDERQKIQAYTGSDLGDEGEISLNFGGYPEKADAEDSYHGADEHADESSSEVGQPTLHRNKDAGKTCKERFSFASFDAGATILKTSSGAKNSKAILVENKDTYMLLECATPNKYVIIELTDDIWVDTIVLANFEFFSSMIRHFRVSVSDRYPVKMDKWKELGTFEARNSRDIQAFLVENPQIWAKYLRLEFLTHYSNEYYCPVSLVRVHGSRMLDKWKDSETGPDEDHIDEIDVVEEIEHSLHENSSESTSLGNENVSTVSVEEVCPLIESTPFQLPLVICPVDKILTTGNGSTAATESFINTQDRKTTEEEATRPEQKQNTSTQQENTGNTAMISAMPENARPVSESSTNSGAERPSENASSKIMKSATTEATSSSSPPAAVAGKSPTASASNRSRGNGTNSATPSPPIQEGFFNSVTKRLQQVETNLTLSLKYVEEQSKHIQDAFQRSEQKQLLKISSVLTDLNQTVLAELRTFRDQYDQIWQSTVLALESQKDQSQRDILALSARLHVLADEVVFQKRMAIVQAVLLLSCLLLVIFSRGVPIPYLGSASDPGMATSEAFAEILASMQRRDMYPSGSPRYTLDARTPTTPEPPRAAGSPPERMTTSQVNLDDYGYQRPSPPLTPNNEINDDAPDWHTSSHSAAVQATGYDKGVRHISSRKPLPSLPEDVSSPGRS
ncbi:hypothetical protein PWT90_04880 [Aphanocladium album]|nr:hypothetical protein PWT90_04880 [Aphanocladium album]